MAKRLFLGLVLGVVGLTGCAASSADPTHAGDETDELKSADCPAKVQVTIGTPSILNDQALVSVWKKDFAGQPDPTQDAQDQLTQLQSHLAKARSEQPVTLTGTLGQRCFYKTVDASTGAPNGYGFWFAKTGGPKGGLQLRITRQLEQDADTLFFNAPVKALTKSTLTVDSTKDARVNAQHTEDGFHGEPEGPNAWIGTVAVSAEIVP